MVERLSRRDLIARRLEVLPLFVTTLAVAAVCLFIFRGERVEARVGSQVFTKTFDFLLMVVMGSGVSVLFQTISYSREVRERRRTLQREIHQALVSGYNDAKRVRRLLRARARGMAGTALLGSDDPVNPEEYDRQLEALSSAQLSIELATRRVEINRNLFRSAADLVDSLRLVGVYLNSIIDEWEDVRPNLGDSAMPLTLARLPQLNAFLRHWRESPQFRDGFKVPFDRVLLLLEQALVSKT